MFISDKYALAYVAPTAYSTVIPTGTDNEDNRTISLLFSIKNRISSWWQSKPVHLNKHSIDEYHKTSVLESRKRIIKSFKLHIESISNICTIPDETSNDMLDSNGNIRNRRNLSQSQKSLLDALHALSKPNTHRLLELYHQWRRFNWHIGWAGELSLEKTHQLYKKHISHSNNHDVHCTSMYSAITKDWKQRMRSCVGMHGYETSENVQRYAFLLLTGIQIPHQFIDVFKPYMTATSDMLHPTTALSRELVSQVPNQITSHAC